MDQTHSQVGNRQSYWEHGTERKSHEIEYSCLNEISTAHRQLLHVKLTSNLILLDFVKERLFTLD